MSSRYILSDRQTTGKLERQKAQWGVERHIDCKDNHKNSRVSRQTGELECMEDADQSTR